MQIARGAFYFAVRKARTSLEIISELRYTVSFALRLALILLRNELREKRH